MTDDSTKLLGCMNLKWINTHKVLLIEPGTQRTFTIIRELFQRKQSTLGKHFPPEVTLDFSLDDELKQSPSRLCLSLSFRILCWHHTRKKKLYERKLIMFAETPFIIKTYSDDALAVIAWGK